MFFVSHTLTIEVSKAHADCNHQSQNDASIKATTELPLVLLLLGLFNLMNPCRCIVCVFPSTWLSQLRVRFRCRSMSE